MQDRMMKRMQGFLLVGLALLLALPGASLAEETPVTQTLQAEFTLPEDAAESAWRLTDGNANSRVSLALGESIGATWQQGEAGALYLQWHMLSEQGYTLVQRDASGAELGRERLTDGLLNRTVTLMDGCASVELLAGDGVVPEEESERQKQNRLDEVLVALSELTVYGKGALPEDVQQWQVRTEQPDVLLVVACPSEEFTVFGGLLPVLLDRGVDVQVLFMTERTADVRNESLAALYALGLSTQPAFAGLTGRGGTDYSMLASPKEWESDGAVYKAVQPYLALWQPKVIVTYSSNRDQENGMHRLTGEAVAKAVEAVRNGEEMDWTPDKYYVIDPGLEESETPLTVPETAAALVTFAGQTGDAMAQQVLTDCFVTQRQYRLQVATGCRYELLESTVGADTAYTDLLEHLDVPPVPTATPAPTAEPTPEPTPEPTQTPEQTAAPEPLDAAAGAMGQEPPDLLLPGAALILGLIVTLVLLLVRMRRGGGKGAPNILVCLVPLAIGVLAAVALYWLPPVAGGQAQDVLSETAALPTQAPEETVSAVATPEPTAEPTAEPKPEPTPTPHPWAEYFRAAGDPEEVVVEDWENGHWEYRSDTLSVIIDRHWTDKPMTYFVAHIRMLDPNLFRAGFSNATNNGGTPKGMPWEVARRNNAVLLLMGDNLIHQEKEDKGVMIRNGWVYYEGTASDTMAIYPDMSMRMFDRKTVTAKQLLEDGVLNSYGFMYDPILIRDGVIQDTVKTSTIDGANPRSALGMVEPGHFVAIVVDGRQTRIKVDGETIAYSAGATLEELAQLFLAEGCTEAYNLDGGISACMVFMGEQLNEHEGTGTQVMSYQRTIPEGLVFGYSTLVPSLDDPVTHTGNRK